ncbi:MAG: P-loop NTPase [Coriobacteriales bacterium]|nr:P-loop NTPase [Coriobacteriales bacterium]
MGASAGQMVVCCGSAYANPLVRHAKQVLGKEVACSWTPIGIDCRQRAAGAQLVLVGPGVSDVEPVNLAAALVKDARSNVGRDFRVVLVVNELTGSLASRAHAAGVEQVATLEGLPSMLSEVASASDLHGSLPAELSADIVEQPATKAVQSSGSGRVVSIVGGRGGVGKSTISLLLALATQRFGISTLLIDLDLQFGDLAYLLDLEAPHTVAEAVGVGLDEAGSPTVSSAPPLLDLVQTVAGEVSFLAAPGLPELGDLIVGRVGDLCARACSAFSMTVLNLGSTWGDVHAEALEASDLALFVMDQRGTSVEACRQASALARRLGMPGARCSYLVNRCGQRGGVTGLDASLALGGAHVYELPDGGRAVDDLVGAGCPGQLFEQENPLAQGVLDLARRLAGMLGVEPLRDSGENTARRRITGRGARR